MSIKESYGLKKNFQLIREAVSLKWVDIEIVKLTHYVVTFILKLVSLSDD